MRNSETRWLKDVLQDMYQRKLIPENPEEYYRTSTHEPTGVVRYHPVSFVFVEQFKEIKRVFNENGLHRPMVFGWQDRRPDDKRAPERLAKRVRKANYLILPELGDCHSITQFLKFLRDEGPQAAKNKKPKVVVIENGEGQYTPILKALFGEAPEGREAADYYQERLNCMVNEDGSRPFVQFHFANDRNDTIKLCQSAKKEIRKNQATFFDNALTKSKEKKKRVETVFIATTEKVKQAQAEISLAQAGISVLPLSDLIGVIEEALELHGTYEGNANGVDNESENSGKAHTVFYQLKRVLEEGSEKEKKKLFDALKRLGIPANGKIRVVVDDRGVEVPAEVMKHFDYENTSHIPKRPFKSAPGVEITYYFQTKGGMNNFFYAVHDAYDKLDEARRKEGITEPIRRTVTNRCVSTVMQIDLKNLSVTMDSATASAEWTLARHPRSKSGIPLSENWYEFPNGQTGGEMDFEDYVPHETGVKALLAAVEVAGIPLVQPKHKKSYTGPFQLGAIGEANFERLSLPEDGFYPPATRSPQEKLRMAPLLLPRRKRGDTYEVTSSSLGQAANIFAGTDAALFTAGHGLKKSALAYLLVSAVVEKQLDPARMGRFLGIERNDPDLNRLGKLMEWLFEAGYFKELPPRIFNSFGREDDKSLSTQINTHKENYRPIPEPTLEHSDEFVDMNEKIGTDRPRVFIACSATSKADSDYLAVRTIVNAYAERGWDILYGGGDKFMMGEIYKAAMDWNKAHPERPPVTVIGISTPNVLKKESEENKFPPGVIGIKTGTIYGRMDNLIGNADHVQTLNGGTGSVQELLAFAKMKEENDPRVEGRKAWLVNSEIVPGKPERLYDPILNYFGDGDRKQGIKKLESLGIYVANSPAESVEQAFAVQDSQE